MTPEGQVKRAIKKFLEQMGAWYHMSVMNGMGKPTLDFICCYRGRFFAIEAKRPGGKVTVRQEQTINEIEAFPSSGVTWVIDSPEQLVLVQVWLESLQ